MISKNSIPTFVFQLLLILLSISNYQVESHSFIYPKFNSTKTCSKFQSKGSKACSLLPRTIPSLLANGYHPIIKENFVLIDAFSKFYPIGTNPNKTELVKDISVGSLSPGDDISSAENSVGDFDEEHVMGEKGYGEWKEGAKEGKLPSFCRFGGSILTSDSSKTYFEVFLPLPDEDSIDESAVDVDDNDQEIEMKKRSFRSNQVHFQVPYKKEKEEKEEDGKVKLSSTGKTSNSSSKLNSNSVSESNSNSNSTSSSASSSSTIPSYCPGNFIPSSRRGWNGRYLHTGNGGQRGIPEYDEMKQSLIRMRIAVSGSNVGHFGSGGQSQWSIGNVEEQLDFGQRGIRVSGIASQLITSLFYGTLIDEKLEEEVGDEKKVGVEKEEASEFVDSISSSSSSSSNSKISSNLSKHHKKKNYPLGFPSYFAGCSTGGRQAFSLIQNSPDLFNGVISGSPVWDYNHLNAFQIHVNSLLSDPNSTKFIPKSKYPLIHKAVLEACDEIDGVKDQVIERPELCKVGFKKVLGCGGGKDVENLGASKTSDDDCLSKDQIETLEEVFKPFVIGDELIFPPFLPGTEDAWTVTDGWVGKPFPPSIGWFQFQVLNHTNPNEDFDPYTQVTPEVIRLGQKLNPGKTIQNNKDITKFFEKGGKLMHYHGLEDQLNPAGISKIYFDGVEKIVGKEIVDDHYKLFFIPGMAHCRGGAGTNFGAVAQTDDVGAIPLSYDIDHDIYLRTFHWTEGGSAPKYLIGVGYNSEDKSPLPDIKKNRGAAQGIRITRKLCPYPQYSVYDGSSDPSVESSFSCSGDD